MARRVSLLTVDWDINNGKSFQESGVILCSDKYFRRESCIPVVPKNGEYSPVNNELEIKQQMISGRKEDPHKLSNFICEYVCEGVRLMKKTSDLWKPKHSLFTPKKADSLSTVFKTKKCMETTAHAEKRIRYNKSVKYLLAKDAAENNFQCNILTNVNQNIHETKIPHNDERNTICPIKQSKEIFQQNQKETDQLPDIFRGHKNDRIKRSPENENDLGAFENLTLQTHSLALQTQRNITPTDIGLRTTHARTHSLDYTDTTTMDGLKQPRPMSSISVCGSPPVWNNSVDKNTPGTYGVRYQYAINIERNWYKNFQREMALKAEHGEQGDADSFGYCSEEIHKKSLFNHLRDEYEVNLSKQNPNYKQLYNVGLLSAGTVCEFTDQPEDINSLKHVPRVNFILNNPLKCGSTEILVSDFNEFERTAKESEFYKHNMQMSHHQEKPNNETEDDSKVNRSSQLTITEIRALRLNLKKFNPTPPLKGIRRFRQMVLVVMFTLHFRKVMMKTRERRRKRMKQHKLAQKRNKVYTPFERSRASTRKSMHGEEKQPDTLICRYAIEMNRIMLEGDHFASIIETISSASNSRHRCLSEPGPYRPKEFYITVSTPIKRNTNSRKRNCKSASQKREVEHGHSKGRPTQRKITNTRFKTATTKVTDTGLIAEIKQQLNIKNTTKTSEVKKNKATREIIVNQDLLKKRCMDDIDLNNKPAIDLRSLLKDMDIPAKEIKIQIAERKMKRRHTKYMLSLIPNKDSTENLKMAEERVPVPKDIPTRRTWSYILRRDVMSGLRWKGRPEREQPKEKPESDEEIANLSSLVLQMRQCRYIRWTKRYQDILSRLDDQECSDI